MKILYITIIFLISIPISAQEIYTMPKGQQSRLSSFENMNGVKGAGGKTNNAAKGNAYEDLKAGASKTLLDVNGAGIIQRMWFTIGDRSFVMLRSLRLQIYWDGSMKPAVDVPFGDFFCTPLGTAVAFESALFTNPEGKSFNCYILMPFKKGARVVLTNEGTKNLNQLFYDIDFLTLPKADPPAMYFHCYWNRAIKSDPSIDFELLPKVNGKGRFLGVNVGINLDSVYTNTWWGEGEVKMFIDGDTKYPTINGTGAEDYIGTGWGEGVFAHQYQGCLVADDSLRQYSFYRFHIPDAIYFYKDFRATIQKIGGSMRDNLRNLDKSGVVLKPVSVGTDTTFTRLYEKPMDLHDPKFPKGWVNFYRVDDYSATAYFYLDRPESNMKELSPVAERVKH